MKILLIDPPYSFEETGGKRRNFKNVINKVPSLGLGYIAAEAESKGHVVKIADCSLGLREKELIRIAKSFDPRVIGITATTPTFSNAANTACMLREFLPKAVYVCGGPAPTASPEECLSADAFDFLVRGEGERTFLELLAYIEEKSLLPPDHIKGIAFKENGKTVITSTGEKIEDLDSLPFPARHLFPPLNAYKPTPASYRGLPVAIIITSRGCPGGCVFCDRKVLGKKLRKRSVSNVIAEVEEVVFKYKAKEIRFFDDSFTFDLNYAENICKAMKKSCLRIPWTCLTRVASVNPDILKLMKESGCWQVLFGLESGDDYVLGRLGKGNTVAQNKQAVLWAKEAGLSIRADFLVGSPWETKDSFMKTIEFAKSLPIDFAHFNKFVPYPGTDIYKDLTDTNNIVIPAGFRGNDTFRKNKVIFDAGSYVNNHHDFAYIPPGFTKADYIKTLNKAYRDFYLRPAYILRKLLSVKTVTELNGYFKGFFSILSIR
jgi:anaerobic magnesium-protoporphyrin IX monomethyl ester cyclase